MIYYHLTPRENKEAILREGLHSKDRYIFLTDLMEDTFLLAPPTEKYIINYNFLKSIYESNVGIYYSWEEVKCLFSVFKIDGSGLDIITRRNGNVRCFERVLHIDMQQADRDRFVNEYMVKRVPPEMILDVTDFAFPYLNFSFASEAVTANCNKVTEMRKKGLAIADIRKAIQPPFPQMVTPFNMNEYIEKK